MAQVKKEYSNGEITVVWKPELCQHAGICVKMLPQVYNPKERPWIKVENATTPELQHQVSNCPSGALSYYMNADKEEESKNKYMITDNQEAKEYQMKVDGHTVRLEYILAKDNKIYLTHTEVPQKLEGRGLASEIIRYALEDIKKRDLTLVPLCPFVASYIKRHPEWKELVIKSEEL